MNTSSSEQKPAIVLIHGMWMTPLSWEHWIDHYTDRGHHVLAPAWPGLDAEPEELRRDPSPLRGLGIAEIVDHYDKIIRGLDRPPIIIGHSFGGLHTQLLLNRGLGAAGVALSTAGCAEAAVHDPEDCLACVAQSREPQKRDSTDPETVPLVLHERAHQGGVGCRLRALLHPGRGAALLPGRPWQLQSERCDQGRLPQSGTATATPRHRGGRSDLPTGREQVEFQAAEKGSIRDGAQGIPGTLPLAGTG